MFGLGAVVKHSNESFTLAKAGSDLLWEFLRSLHLTVVAVMRNWHVPSILGLLMLVECLGCGS